MNVFVCIYIVLSPSENSLSIFPCEQHTRIYKAKAANHCSFIISLDYFPFSSIHSNHSLCFKPIVFLERYSDIGMFSVDINCTQHPV